MVKGEPRTVNGEESERFAGRSAPTPDARCDPVLHG